MPSGTKPLETGFCSWYNGFESTNRSFLYGKAGEPQYPQYQRPCPALPPYFRKYRKTMAFDLCCAALTTVCELVLPLIVRTITTRATYDVASLTVPFVLMMGGVYMLLRVIDAAANYYMQSIGHIMGSQLETDMRHDIFHHLQELSFGYYSDTKVGQIMARITSDLFEITEFAHHCPEEFLIAGVKILVSFIILCTMNIPMTLMMFAVLPFMLYFAKRFNTKMRQIFKERNKQVGEINAQVEDSLLGIRVVKSFANEEIEEKKFADGNAKFLDLKAQSYRVMAQFGTSNRIFDGLMYIVIVVGGALFIKAGWLSAADFMAYLLYANVLLNSIRRIVEFTEQFQRGMTGIDRFLEIMDAPAEIVDAPNAKVLTDVRGEVAFDHVSFHYQDDDADAIHNLNMTVRPGQSIALVGPSGAGKTTLCNLIPRFYDVTGGCIRIDGRDIRTLTQEPARSHRHGAAGSLPVRRVGAGRSRIRQARRIPRGSRRSPQNWRVRTSSSPPCPTAMTLMSANAAFGFPADRSSAFPSRVCS